MMQEIQDRRSIRKYTDRKIDEKTILQLIESARLAPSGSNTQPWHFLTITSQKMREKVARVSHDQKWMLSAPLFIACIAETASDQTLSLDEQSCNAELKRCIRDTSIATEHIALEAVKEGLGTCYVAWFTQNEIKAVLGLPSNTYVVSILTVGYPDENPIQRNRKKIQEILHTENW
jgi:nitroreductase